MFLSFLCRDILYESNKGSTVEQSVRLTLKPLMFYVAVFHPFYDSACDKTPTTPHIGCNDHFPLQHINWNWWKWEAHPRKTQIFGSLNYKSFQTFSYLFCHLKFNQCLNWILMGMLHFEKKILPGFFISAIALKSMSNSGAIVRTRLEYIYKEYVFHNSNFVF